MVKNFQLIHRRKPATFKASPLVWETCLRSISFSPLSETTESQDEIFQESDAVRFILEIICGLHSPVVGETEVFGQFKNFAKQWLAQEPFRAPLVQRLFAEAKELRSKHLRGLGTQSYGSWIKRQLKSDQVHILGAGQLVQEILPHIQKQAASVTVHVREPKRAAQLKAEIKNLRERAFNGGSLIIAAPMPASEIEKWLRGPAHQVFDLRDNSHLDRLHPARHHHVLQDIFSEIEQTRARLQPVIAQMKTEIRERSEKLASQIHVRPQGWDDICA